MKKNIVIVMLLLIAFVYQVEAQGIQFFKGSYEEALAKAKGEGKLVFIDFFATWCEPCKELAKTVFPDSLVGVYFNQKFVCIQLDTDDKDNRGLVKQYKVTAMPTLVFLDAEGKQLSHSSGMMRPHDFLKLGKVVTGDELGFENAYEQYKLSKNDLVLLQMVLKEAPAFVSAQEGIDRDKWTVRVEKLYKSYIEQKMGPELINKDDYRIICTYHQSGEKGDKLIEFMNENIDMYFEKVGKSVGAYVLEHQNKVIETLARAGNQEYLTQLERVKGDMVKAYSVMPAVALSPYDRLKYNYDAEYLLYFKKDAEAYVTLKKKYFEAMGDSIPAADYGIAAQSIYYATGGKVNDDIHRQAMEWTRTALQNPHVSLMDKLNYLVMLGDNYKALKDYKQAKECYNQAYVESLQLGQPMSQRFVQMRIKQKLAVLELLK